MSRRGAAHHLGGPARQVLLDGVHRRHRRLGVHIAPRDAPRHAAVLAHDTLEEFSPTINNVLPRVRCQEPRLDEIGGRAVRLVLGDGDGDEALVAHVERPREQHG